MHVALGHAAVAAGALTVAVSMPFSAAIFCAARHDGSGGGLRLLGDDGCAASLLERQPRIAFAFGVDLRDHFARDDRCPCRP